MDLMDNLSTKSSESSITTSGEYEIVTNSNIATPTSLGIDESQADAVAEVATALAAKEVAAVATASNIAGSKSPTLDMANSRNINDIQCEMKDALLEIDADKRAANATTTTTAYKQKFMTLPLAATSSPALMVPENSETTSGQNQKRSQTLERSGGVIASITPKSEDSLTEPNRVGQSVFYDCVDATAAAAADMEKHDIMKCDKNDTDEDISEIDQGCTIFSGVTYLGAANINAPKSELDVYRNMCELNKGSAQVGLKISISIPNSSDGLVVLHDAETNSIISTYEIQSIILYFRGPVETEENGCFAFTWLHGDSLFQCHVFRCHIPEAVNQVSACFQKAFQTYPPSMTCSLTSAIDNSNMMNSITSDQLGNPLNTAGYEFLVSMEIRERVAKNSNSFAAVPRDRSCFKLRTNTDKEVFITVKQTPSTVLQPLLIERCFGVLLSAGKLVRQADMQLIDHVNVGYQQPQQAAAAGGGDGAASAQPTTPLCLNPYSILAEWKAKAHEALNMEATKTYLTIAVDIVMRGIQEPVRFVLETPVTIQSAGEIRIMDHFISKRPMTMRFFLHLKRTTDEFSWEVSSIDPSEEVAEQSNAQHSSNLLKFGMTNLTRIVRSSSIASMEEECATDEDLSDGDEPLLSGTGEVSKDCSQDTLDEWDPILKEWDGEKRPKNLANLVRLGVPEALREKIWQKLSNVEGKTDMLDLYRTLLTKETKSETVIQRDINRTFPAHKCFKESGGSGQDSLFKVSKAYAVYDEEVGYCQGLSFIAASLLLHMPEEDAFCVLVALMYEYRLRDLYKPGFEVLYLRLYQLDRLIKDHLPKLHEHFAICGVETHMYASQWFLTLYTARFPLCFVFHVLDVFLLDGLPLLFQVAITLLSICENELRQLDFEGILKYFRVTLPKKCRSASHARRIMKMACDRKIKKLKQYEEEFMLKKQTDEREEREAKAYERKFGDERRKLQAEIDALQQQLGAANTRAVERERKHTGIIQDYKQIIQRLEQDMTTLNESLGSLMGIVAKCSNCSHHIENSSNSEESAVGSTNESTQNATVSKAAPTTGITDNLRKLNKNANEAPLGPLDPLSMAMQRVRELELELANAKLAHVQAECLNQDLNHQLNTTLTEMQTNRNSWQPWYSKALNSIQEKVTTRNNREGMAATFQSYTGTPLNAGSETNSPSSNQEFKAFSMGGSPKLPTKFNSSSRIRSSIDSLRNIVVVPEGATASSAMGLLRDSLKFQQQQQSQDQQQPQLQQPQYIQQQHSQY